eukprot:evm.model.scf_1304.3 EVM.evm.TU.scf_1304.3   scf_1304:25882-27425(+)
MIPVLQCDSGTTQKMENCVAGNCLCCCMGFQGEAMAVFVDPSVPVKSLVDLLLKPFRVLKRIKEVEEDVPFLHGRVLVLDGTLKSIREDTRFDGDGWQTVMPEERWQKLHESLQVFEKILEKADNLAKKIDQYKGRLKMWVYAKGLKTSLEDSHVELDRVDQGLANVRTLLGEPEPSKKQQQVDQLRRISLEGRPVEPVEDAPQKSAETNEVSGARRFVPCQGRQPKYRTS